MYGTVIRISAHHLRQLHRRGAHGKDQELQRFVPVSTFDHVISFSLVSWLINECLLPPQMPAPPLHGHLLLCDLSLLDILPHQVVLWMYVQDTVDSHNHSSRNT